MNQRLRYLEIKVNNSSQADLLIMLYETLVSQGEDAVSFLNDSNDPQNYIRASQSVTRSINILTELTTSLNPEVYPQLTKLLCELYRFFTQQFSIALEERKPNRIQAILPLISELHKAWVQAQRMTSTLAHAQAA